MTRKMLSIRISPEGLALLRELRERYSAQSQAARGQKTSLSEVVEMALRKLAARPAKA
jgi:hypothetical protein